MPESDSSAKGSSGTSIIHQPAFNDLHPIHELQVLVFVLHFGHDHCSCWGVILHKKNSNVWTSQFFYHPLITLYTDTMILSSCFLSQSLESEKQTRPVESVINMLPLPAVVRLGLSSGTNPPRCTLHKSRWHTAWWTWSPLDELVGWPPWPGSWW